MALTQTTRFQRPDNLQIKETAESLDKWISDFKVYIQRDPVFAPFLTETWNYDEPNMGFTDPVEGVARGDLPATKKGTNCQLFLAHFTTFVKRPYYNKGIQERTTSCDSIWKLLRSIYNVEPSAENLLDIGDVTFDKSESHLSFFHKIIYLIESNMAPAAITVDHVTTGPTGDRLSVTLMDVAAVMWINKLDPRLYDRVKVEFAVRIKNGERLSSMVPDIAKAIPGMLKLLNHGRTTVNHIQDVSTDSDSDPNGVNTKIFNLNSFRNNRAQRGGTQRNRASRPHPTRPFQRRKPTCSHCTWLKETLGIREVDINHSSDSCTRALPNKVRAVIDSTLDNLHLTEEGTEEETDKQGQHKVPQHRVTDLHLFQIPEKQPRLQPPDGKAQDTERRENTVDNPENVSLPLSDKKVKDLKTWIHNISRTSSPKIRATIRGHMTSILIDEGAEIDCMDSAFSKKIGQRLATSSRSATAAGSNDLTILGEAEDDVIFNTNFQSTKIPINMGKITIIDNLGVDVILSEAGKARNGIRTDPTNRTIILEREGKKFETPYLEAEDTRPRVCRLKQGPATLYPGDDIELDIPEDLHHQQLAIIPRGTFTNVFNPSIRTVEKSIKLVNTSTRPFNVKTHDHLADIRRVTSTIVNQDPHPFVHNHSDDRFKFESLITKQKEPDTASIEVDPDNLMPKAIKKKFLEANERYKHLFTKQPGRYSGFYGDSNTNLQFISPPVQTRKVATPSYNRDMLDKLAAKMDELRDDGILISPEKIGVSVQFMSPSMLVPKTGEDNQFRLVTDFTNLNRFIKRDMTTSPTINQARSDLSQKKLFCEMDLANYFFQGGMLRHDCAFLGVQHPYDGPLVYTASPQGLKNSSEHSYNRLGLVFGPMIQQKKLTRMADGLFPIANSYEELLDNYIETLERADNAGLTFKPTKTRIAPNKATIFGWDLVDGTWSPQQHTISSLTRAAIPTTIKQMRSFNGAVKQLSACVPHYAELLHPLEKIIGSKSSSEKVIWNEELDKAFNDVKKAIANPQGIQVPRRSDRLQTSSDFSKAANAIGGMLTIIREVNGQQKSYLGGHYSARIEGLRSTWFPCDGEAYACKQVLTHFAPVLRDSLHESVHLTDSLPVVMAWKRMLVGRFSTSPRISTLLSTLAGLPVRLQHSPGSNQLLTDQSSRNPPDPCTGKCEICLFNKTEADRIDKVYTLNTNDDNKDILDDMSATPYLQLKTWLNEQRNDAVHCKLMSLINTGQEPEKRKTGGVFTVVKHLHQMYLKDNLQVHKSGVIMVRQKQGYYNGFTISVPEQILFGLAFMFHAKLQHPKKTQLTRFLSRYYYAPGMPTIVDTITTSCLHCSTTASLPKPLLEQSTTIPLKLGTSFAADVLERQNQFVFVCKDEFSQFVSTTLAESQTTPDMRNALISSIAPFINIDGATVRLDNAPAFRSLESSQLTDPILLQLKLKIETSRSKNKNGNPVAESSVAELKKELLNVVNHNDTLDNSTLALATRNLNGRVRSNGKSALETLTQRDTLTGSSAKVNNEDISQEIKTRREKQHLHDMTCKAKTRKKVEYIKYSVGDIVMVSEQSTLDKRRDTYIVVKDEGDLVEIRKLGNKLRLETYHVDRNQLTPVFQPPKPPNKPNTQAASQQVHNTHPPTTKPLSRPTRKAAIKSRLRTHSLAMQRVTSIKEPKQKKKKWVYITYHIAHTDQPDAAVDHDEPDQDPPPDNDNNLVNQDPADYGSIGSNLDPMSDADHDIGFMGYDNDLLDQLPPWSPNMSPPTSPDVFHDDNASEDIASLDWDNLPTLVEIGNHLESTRADQLEDTPTPSPGSRPAISPISPYDYNKRITRSIVHSGQFDYFQFPVTHPIRTDTAMTASQSSSETPLSGFRRLNPMRRPLSRPVKVTHEDDETIVISDRQWEKLAAREKAKKSKKGNGTTNTLPLTVPSGSEASL